MARLVEEHRHELVRRTAKERIQDHHFWHGVVRPASMSADAPRRAGGGEEHDNVAAELDVGFQRGTLFFRQLRMGRIQGERFESVGINRKTGLNGHAFASCHCLG